MLLYAVYTYIAASLPSPAAKLPLGTAAPWVHELYAVVLAVLAFAIVFGAFAGNVLQSSPAPFMLPPFT